MGQRYTRVEVNGSLLTDATCAHFEDPAKISFFSTVHVGLLARYMRMSLMTDRVGKQRVLDIGCNTGSALMLHSHVSFQRQGRKALEYTGMDLHEPSIVKAKQHAWRTPSAAIAHSPTFIHHDITEPWPLEDASFDVLWYTETIEHVPVAKAQYTLEEAYRVAAPGADMMCATPAPLDDELVWPDSHDHEFTREEMRAMLDATGWELVDEYGVDSNFTKTRVTLRREHPEMFEMYEKLRTRLTRPIAAQVIHALMPELAFDIVYMCRKRD